MKLTGTKQNLRYLFFALIFVGTALVVFKLLPNRAQFDLHYELGRPWHHTLLTAPFDFPIFKNEAELNRELDSVMQFYKPYYKTSEAEVAKVFQQLKSNRQLASDHLLSGYVERTLKSIYRNGILDTKSLDALTKQRVASVVLIDSQNVERTVKLTSLFTQKTAYDFLCTHSAGNEKRLRDLNLDRYIVENLVLDTKKSSSVIDDLHNRVSLTSGMVQTGQRIIDRGEIVDAQTLKILDSYKRAVEKEQLPERSNGWVIVGELLLIAGLLLLFALFLVLFRKEYILLRNAIFFMSMILLIVTSASLVIRFTTLDVNIVPFALMPIIVRIFFDSRTGLFIHLITVLLVALMVPNPYMFLMLQVTAGMVAVSSLKQMNRRSQLVQVAGFVLLNYIVVFVGMTLVSDGSFSSIQWESFVFFAINALLLLFAYVLIFIFEKIFGYLSDVTLVELSNINNRLLMEFSEKAPGSFQHVLQVSNLAAEAAAKIGANSLMARTGALYHDIGKMSNAMTFTENQLGGINPLANKPYEEAAQIIIAHVAEGVRLAEKAGLPRQIIGFIRTHHARSVTRYFYNSYRNAYPDKPVDVAKFTYPGPLPDTKEEAIVMMADAVEATSRSLKDYSEESISTMVDTIINGQIAEQSLRDAPITFRDVEKVKNVFKDKLKNIYHNRITYPELNVPTESEAAKTADEPSAAPSTLPNQEEANHRKIEY